MAESLTRLLSDIRACRVCESELEHGAKPIVRASKTARICIVGQAPGLRAHNSGVPYSDPSGNRLREWMGIDPDSFYDQSRIAIVPMGFCFPGYDKHGGDKPPRKECVAHWRTRLFETLPPIELTLLVGSHAQNWHLGVRAKTTMTETVHAWRDYRPRYIPLPHPSWRNSAWLNKNPWFATELLPYLRSRVRRSLR